MKIKMIVVSLVLSLFCAVPRIDASLITPPRTFDQYLLDCKKSGRNTFVMIVGATHEMSKLYNYPSHFCLVDANKHKFRNATPDFEFNISALTVPEELLNKFDVVVFEYIYADGITPQGFKNAYNFLKPGGKIILDVPGEIYKINEKIKKVPHLIKEVNIPHSYGEQKEEILFFDIKNISNNDRYDIFIRDIENPNLKDLAISMLKENIKILLTEAGYNSVQFFKHRQEEPIKDYFLSTNMDSSPPTGGFVMAIKP